ncbi:putative RNA-directed DNA polymerase [Tanacetum coccineum]
MDIAMREFKECVADIEVFDVHNTGLQYTWNQKPKGKDGILKKLDRIMANMAFSNDFVGAHAIFKPYRNSDHSPSILCIPTAGNDKPKPFKFFNVLTKHERFRDIVNETWNIDVSGFFMFRIVKKLKFMKKPFRKLMYDKGNLHANVDRLHGELDQIQSYLDKDPFNQNLREREAVCVVEFNQAILVEERFLKQKAKINWLKDGDANSAYFHKAVKSRVSRSRIEVVMNNEGLIFANDKVPDAFISHYETFIGQAGDTNGFDDSNLFTTRLDDQVALNMIHGVTDREIKDAMFSMGDDKSPGPDGYSAAFFKEAWSIVGDDVIKAIREFFTNGKLLKELNHTIIALIPKVQAPSRINDYRPISCCNVLFKCISKIIANRIKHCLKTLISPNQSAFIPGRSISDNILLTQELMHNYHLDRGTPRCAFKVDIQKAYDTVDWNFLRTILVGFGFHNRMISWIMECVTTTSYSICINGTLHGYFQGKFNHPFKFSTSYRWSFSCYTYIWLICIQRRVLETNQFIFHRYCAKLNLINLCFADDLFLFAHGDVQSASIINNGLDEFKHASGLIPSLPKSTAYFCNVLNHIKISILNVLPFEEGHLPVKYLGVPLISSRLKVRDCKELVEKVENRVQDWKNKSLSIAGRLQLIRSVIGSMHIFWASVFIIPNRVLIDIEQIMRKFLWCPGNASKGKAKVAWDVVCLPKDEGGLGIRRLDCFNSALMVSHLWKLLSSKESLWVKWVHMYKLNGRNFWDIPLRGNMSWSWRKILQLRPIIREFVWCNVGNGLSTSLWFDKWCVASPLYNHVSSRDIFRSGLTLSSHVNDIVRDGVWDWPRELLDKYPILDGCYTHLSNEDDRLEWRLHDGTVKHFSVSQVWSSIRPRGVKVPWVDMIWFALNIPKHAFNMWLIINHKLKTQDRLSVWDVSTAIGSTCSLCDSTQDSHEHLFFICPFSNTVWSHMKSKAGLDRVSHDIYAIVDHIGGNASRKSTCIVIAKLVVAASAYFIWQERNWRLFKKTKRSTKQVIECISSSVRLKLLSCRFKRTLDGVRYARMWDLPDSIFR